jgi:hypothetical protein
LFQSSVILRPVADAVAHCCEGSLVVLQTYHVAAPQPLFMQQRPLPAYIFLFINLMLFQFLGFEKVLVSEKPMSIMT